MEIFTRAFCLSMPRWYDTCMTLPEDLARLEYGELVEVLGLTIQRMQDGNEADAHEALDLAERMERE